MGSVEREILAFFGGSLLFLVPKKQGLEDQGTGIPTEN